MKTFTINALILLLVIAISLVGFTACNPKTEDTLTSSETDTSDVSSSEAPSSEVEDSSEPEDTADGDFYDDEEEFNDDFEPEDGVYYESLSINNKKYVNENFMGIGYIHQMFSYQRDKRGYVYTDEQRALEMEIFEKMNVKSIRAYYGADYSWDPVTGTRNFESEEMLNFYKACKAMDKIGVEIGVTAQWSLGRFLVGSSGYNSMGQFDLSGLVTDDFDETCRNYKQFMKETVLALKAHGVNNLKNFFVYTECHHTFNDGLDINGNPTDEIILDHEYERLFPIFNKAVTALDEGLKEAGLRNQYKIVGPCDNWYGEAKEVGYSPLIKYCVEEMPEIIDVIGSHAGYAEGTDLSNDVYYDIPQELHAWGAETARKAGKQIWVDEFNVRALGYNKTTEERYAYNDNAIRGVAAGAMVNGILNYGNTDNVFIWTLFDEQWPDNNSGGVGSEFDNGIQLCGYFPCLFETTVPYKPWYAMSLMSRYIGAGKIYECEVSYGLYISAIERDDGEITLLVTNYNLEETPCEISFAKSVGGKNFYRYRYEPDSIVPAQGSEMITADAVVKNVTDKFYDSMPPFSVTVYSTQKN